MLSLVLLVGKATDLQSQIDAAKGTFVLPAGRIELRQPLMLRSGTKLVGSKKGTVLSGGTEIKGWKVGPDGRWRVTLLDVKTGKWNFSQLWVNGERRLRPRWPKNGYSYIEKRIDPLPEFAGKGTDGFVFPEGSMRSEWQNQDDLEVKTWLEWSISHGRIRSLDLSNRVVRFKMPTGINDSWSKYKETYRFYVENVKESLSEPGEWYLDRPTGELTYLPQKGEVPSKTIVIAPRLSNLVVVRKASKVALEDIGFEHTQTLIAEQGRFFYQAEADLTAAVVFEESQESQVSRCKFKNLGEYAVKIGDGCKSVTAQKNSMIDLGGGGVLVGHMQKRDDNDPLCTGNISILENSIFGYGRVHPASIGVWIGQNANNKVVGNWIEDGYYTGISVGWSWGYAPSGSHDNLIINNTISKIGQKVMSDMGGIYTLSPSAGTVISGNRISQVDSYSYGGWGIYPDEGSSNMTVERNLTWKTSGAGFHQHYGKDNLIRNNVFALGKEFGMQRSRNEEHQSFTVERNLFLLSAETPVFGPEWGWGSGKYAFSSNLYWRENGAPIPFLKGSFQDWQSKGFDKASVIANPEFVDAENGNFRLKSSSPALGLGFEAFEALSPRKRPGGLPTSVVGTFPVPTKFFPSIWN